jgi:hypothetical protein
MAEIRRDAEDGSADPRVTAALADYAAGTGAPTWVLAVLAQSRLLVPVVAVLDEVDRSARGIRTEKSAHMATVSTTGLDGRRGLLAFTSLETLRRWQPDARPVPAPAPAIAAAAVEDGAEAVVVDIAGPVLFAIEGRDLQSLAAGWTASA